MLLSSVQGAQTLFKGWIVDEDAVSFVLLLGWCCAHFSSLAVTWG